MKKSKNVKEKQGNTSSTTNPLSIQVGGNHYAHLTVQPVEYIHKNNLGFIEGCVIKYVTRYKYKNGAKDLKKARHFIDMLLELEYPDAA